MVGKNFGQKFFHAKFFCPEKISVEQKFGPTNIWLKKNLVQKILVKNKFGKKIW